MRSKLVYFFAGALVAMLSSAATRALDARPGIKKGTHVNLSAEDFIEIMQLQNQYPRDVDPGSVRNGAWKFARDAVQVVGAPAPLTKPADFENFFGTFIAADGQAKKGGVRHFNTSPVIIGLPDGTARGSSMMLSVAIKEKGGLPVIDGMGKYEDLYVKTPDGWRIKERHMRRDDHVGSYPTDLVPSPVLTDPSTWSTQSHEMITRQHAAGLGRDEKGNPIGPPRTRQ